MPEASPRRPLGHSPNSKGDGCSVGKRAKPDEEPNRLSFNSDGDAAAAALSHPEELENRAPDEGHGLGIAEPAESAYFPDQQPTDAPPASLELSDLMDESLSMHSPPPAETVREPVDPGPDHSQAPIEVSFIRSDWDELPADKKKGVIWNFFVNGCTWAQAYFSTRHFILYFTTSDEEYLARHRRDHPHRLINRNTVFSHDSGPLFDRVIPDHCRMTLHPSRKRIEVLLIKAKEAFWLQINGQASPQQEEGDMHCMEDGLPDSPLSSSPPAEREPDSIFPVSFPRDSDDEEPGGPRVSTPDPQYNGGVFPYRMMQPPLQRWTSSGDVSLNMPLATPVVPPHLRMHYGMTGLNNLGNSCYLGAVVQCLANTKELRDYFLRGYYRKEINRTNPLGSKGRFAAVMDETLRALWSGTRSNYSPFRLREAMGRSNEQFSGYGQQDAQEAMAMIIDSLHEDLNRVTVKPYLNEINSDNRPDEEVAKQTWEYHLSRDNSAIHDLFSGMFKSTVECPDCDKKNIKFDLYQCISVPVPKIGIILDCFFFPREADHKVIKFRINVNRDHTISSHYPQIQSHLGDVSMASVRILVLKQSRDRKSFEFVGKVDKEFECKNLDESYQFLLFEVLTEKVAKEAVREFVITQHMRITRKLPPLNACTKCGKGTPSLKRCLYCFLVGYCDKDCQRNDWKQHKAHCVNQHGPAVGLPFIFAMRESQLNANVFYMQVATNASRFVQYASCAPSAKRESCCSSASDMSISPEKQSPVQRSASADCVAEDMRPASSDLDSGMGSSCSTVEDVDVWECRKSIQECFTKGFTPKSFPFSLVPLEKGLHEPWNIYPRCTTATKDAAAVEEQIRQHSLFLLLWHNRPEDKMAFCDTRDLDGVVLADESCLTLKKQEERRPFAAQNYEETLEHCIELLTQPEVLSKHNAWMCPTCKQPREASKKFEIWSLPTVLVFQLKRFCKPTGEVWRRDKIDTMVKYPLIGLDMSKFLVGPGDGGQYLYDLYGVVHHRGSTWYGHYFGHTRCYDVPDTMQDEMPWRSFDDESVEEVTERDVEKIVERGAYLLFYRRRNTDNPILLPAGEYEEEEEDDEETEALLHEEEDGPAWTLQGALALPRPAVRRVASLLRYYCRLM